MLQLIFPPPWDTFTAYPSIPVLLQDLKSNGVEAKGLDLNLKLLEKLTTPQYLIEACEKLKYIDFDSYSEDGKKIIYNAVEKAEYIINNIEEAKARLLEKKYDLESPPRLDREIMAMATNLLSATFFPCQWQRNTYWIHNLKKKRPQTFDDVFNHIESQKEDFFSWAYEQPEILPLIIPDNAKMIGISVTTINQVIPAFVLSKTIKKYNPNIHIVLGGAFIRYIEQPIMKTPKVFEYFDTVIFGKGEGVLAQLYKAYCYDGNFEKIPGVTYLHKDKVISNPPSKIFRYNRIATPDYSSMNIKDYYNDEYEVSYISSSGCYWGKCSFCSETSDPGKYRYMVKSADNVTKELSDIIAQTNVNVIEMSDNAIPVNKAIKIADYMIESKNKTLWTMLARMEDDYNEGVLKHLYKGGLRFISWGLETFSPAMQQLVNKGICMDSAIRILKESHEQGIWNHLFLIIGFPGETKESMMMTLETLDKYKEYIDSVALSNYHLHRNSIMYNNPEKYNLKIKDGSELRLDTSYWYEAPEVDLGMPIESLYGLFELYLSNFHFHTSNFRGFSTAKICTLIDQYGKKEFRKYIEKESYKKTLEISKVI